ncbi:MAG: iron-containing alcohol dehydrogenase [Clostridia bacterium]|nr:iron-containing alcohol dehydrogenase [Clostridia bacterium]
MNTFKKLYCRIFQKVFKIAIPILPYSNPYIIDSTTKIPDILIKKNIDIVLIITDEAVHKLGLIDTLKKTLENKKIKYSIYDKTQPNPTVNNVEEALKMYIDNGAKALIGFGGGSSIDCAKAVGARVARPKKSISKMEGIIKIRRRIPYLIAVPTTAGTGSEVTVATVITDSETNHKFPINDFVLIPNVAVLDSEVTKTLPPHITSTTGMDALTHAVEAFIGRSTVKSTREDALNSVKLIAENLEKAYSNGDDLEARENMLQASFLAGRAFSKSYVGYCHAIAHSLGGKYKIPHGLANAVILPHILEAYGESVYPKLKKLALAMDICTNDTPEDKAAQMFIDKVRTMNSDMNIPSKLSGIKKEDILQLAAYADKEANPLYPVPVLMDRFELEKIYYEIMEE